MTVELLKNPRNRIVIEEKAIIPEGRQALVLVVDPKAAAPTAVKREVILGTRRPGNVEIVDHLKQGEFVIVKGTMVASPGQQVTITAQEKPVTTVEEGPPAAATQGQ